MRKRHIILPIIVALAGGTGGLLQLNRSPQAQGVLADVRYRGRAEAAMWKLEASDDRMHVEPGSPVAVELNLHPGKGKVRLERRRN